jgi:hypothetical protein
MKKITITLLFIFCIFYVTKAQKTKPIVITKPNAIFLQNLQNVANTISTKPLKMLDSAQKNFVMLLKSATNANSWDKAAYKKFAKNATLIIKSLGIMSDSDDGGEIFSDPDDGGEVFASSKLITKALNQVLIKLK